MKTKIVVKTDDPKGLLKLIHEAIESGAVETWEVDGEGDFTHKPDQWKNQAWLRPRGVSEGLELRIVWPTKSDEAAAVRGVYLGRFIEMLVTHFPGEFATASAI